MPKPLSLEPLRPEDPVIRPRSDVVYSVHYEWRGEAGALSLEVSEAFERTFTENDARLDLRSGEVIYKNGRRQDLMASKAKFKALTGQEPPPFLFRWPLGEAKPFVVPKDRLWVDWDVEADRAAFELPRSCVPIFTCLDAPYLGASLFYDDAAFTELRPHESPRVRRRARVGDVEIVAVDEASADLAERVLMQVCGASLRGRALMNAMRLMVVPLGKHFSALPEARGGEPQAGAVKPSAFDVSVTSQKPFSAATLVREGVRYVFLPLEDLQNGAHSARHELYHVIEDELLDAEAKQAIAAHHRETVERAGPFARPYGYLASEFFATLGEVFGGAFGEPGRAWLAREHPSMWSLFTMLEQGVANDDVA